MLEGVVSEVEKLEGEKSIKIERLERDIDNLKR